MSHPFDLFRLHPNGTSIWFGSAEDMESARQMIRQDAGVERTRFMIFTQTTQGRTYYEATKDEVVFIGENLDAHSRS